MYRLEVEPLDLGEDVRAVGLELTEADEDREPVRGREAAEIWSRALPAMAGGELWALDFFSHLDRVREFCANHQIEFREAGQHAIVVPSPEPDKLLDLFERFQNETFGARAGGPLPSADPVVEGELARQGLDGYHKEFPRYFFCAVCNFEDGSLVLLSNKLWGSEVIRRMQPALRGLDVEVRLST